MILSHRKIFIICLVENQHMDWSQTDTIIIFICDKEKKSSLY